MYFRFCCAIILLVLISLAGIFLEKQSLTYRRAISKQHFQKDILQDEYSRLRLLTHQYGSPDRIYQRFNEESNSLDENESNENKKQKLLLSF